MGVNLWSLMVKSKGLKSFLQMQFITRERWHRLYLPTNMSQPGPRMLQSQKTTVRGIQVSLKVLSVGGLWNTGGFCVCNHCCGFAITYRLHWQNLPYKPSWVPCSLTWNAISSAQLCTKGVRENRKLSMLCIVSGKWIFMLLAPVQGELLVNVGFICQCW